MPNGAELSGKTLLFGVLKTAACVRTNCLLFCEQLAGETAGAKIGYQQEN
jgi:hypothetical protein